MGAVIDFGIKKHWRMAETREIANFVWFYEWEKGLCQIEGREFALKDEPAFVGLWAEVRRRAKCGDVDMMSILYGDPDWLMCVKE